MLPAMAVTLLAALSLALQLPPEPRRGDPLSYAAAGWRECLARQLAAPAATAQSDEDRITAVMTGCHGDEGAVHAFFIIRDGERRGNREFEAAKAQMRRDLLAALHREPELAPQGNPK